VVFSKTIPKYNFRRRRLLKVENNNKIGYISKNMYLHKKMKRAKLKMVYTWI
jgi:hypothetical protein